jgi:hypothetical protein
VLLAYTWRNPTAGYCQGFNCIVGGLLMFGFSEEQCFWLFAQMIKVILPLDYYVGILTDQKLLARQLLKKLRVLGRHLAEKAAEYVCSVSSGTSASSPTLSSQVLSHERGTSYSLTDTGPFTE